jgi:hypothetical protein
MQRGMCRSLPLDDEAIGAPRYVIEHKQQWRLGGMGRLNGGVGSGRRSAALGGRDGGGAPSKRLAFRHASENHDALRLPTPGHGRPGYIDLACRSRVASPSTRCSVGLCNAPHLKGATNEGRGRWRQLARFGKCRFRDRRNPEIKMPVLFTSYIAGMIDVMRSSEEDRSAHGTVWANVVRIPRRSALQRRRAARRLRRET